MRTVVTFALLLVSALALGQTPKPGEVDILEVKRWGDRVTEVGTGIRAAEDALHSMALQVPADDSDMWYVTVWGSSTDPATKTLVSAFEKDDNLACFIAKPPGDNKKPWAHFNVYYANDGTQKWRFNNAKIPLTGPFPIITLQAPRNGHFGDPKIIIDRIEAAGIKSPKDLNKRITSVINMWCKKLATDNYIPPKEAVEQFYGTTSVTPDTTPKGGHGQQAGFPWGPDAPPKQPSVNPIFPVNGPAADPTTPSGEGLGVWLNDNAGLLVGILVVLKAIQMFAPAGGMLSTIAGVIAAMLEAAKKVKPVQPVQPVTPAVPQGYVLVPAPAPATPDKVSPNSVPK